MFPFDRFAAFGELVSRLVFIVTCQISRHVPERKAELRCLQGIAHGIVHVEWTDKQVAGGNRHSDQSAKKSGTACHERKAFSIFPVCYLESRVVVGCFSYSGHGVTGVAAGPFHDDFIIFPFHKYVVFLSADGIFEIVNCSKFRINDWYGISLFPNSVSGCHLIFLRRIEIAFCTTGGCDRSSRSKCKFRCKGGDIRSRSDKEGYGIIIDDRTSRHCYSR